jgi:transcriptional regulator with XRE-family HTH domain
MLSDRLRQLREENNLLQKDIASMLNITTSAYGYYEQGKREPNTEALQKLADYYNVSIDYLLCTGDYGINVSAEYAIIGKRIKDLRNKAGLTQFELGQKLGISQNSIGMYEQNKRLPDVNAIIKLTQFFNVSTDYLLGAESTFQMSMGESLKNHQEIIDMQSAFTERFIKLYCLNKLDFDNEEKSLGLTHKQISDIKSTRLPDLIELKQLSDVFKVSINYLLGLPDYFLSDDEKELLEYYSSLNKVDKRLIMGNMVALIKQSNYSSFEGDYRVAENILYSNLASQLPYPDKQNMTDKTYSNRIS